MDKRKASYVMSCGMTPHPIQKGMEEMISNQKVLQDMAQFVSANTEYFTSGVANWGEVMKKAKELYYEDFKRKVFDPVSLEYDRSQGDAPATMPTPPPANIVYGKVGQAAKILDIGSGDGKRLVRYEERFDAILTDVKKPRKLISASKFEQLGAREALRKYPSRVVTSFNLISQSSFSEHGSLSERVGLHLAPDVNTLHDLGYCHGHKNGNVHIFKDARGVEYPDIAVERERFDAVVPVNEFYNLYCSFGIHENVYVQLKHRIKVEQNYPSVGERMKLLKFKDGVITPKYDGVQVTLMCRDGKAHLFLRNGEGFGGTCGRMHNMVLTFEYLRSANGNNVLVLLDVTNYLGIKFGGNLSVIEAFTGRKGPSVIIGDAAVQITTPKKLSLASPSSGVIDGLKYDGLVLRQYENQYLVKNNKTVDLDYSTVIELQQYCKHNDIKITITGPTQYTSEYEVSMEEGVLSLTFVRERTDKTTTTRITEIFDTIGLPTADQFKNFSSIADSEPNQWIDARSNSDMDSAFGDYDGY
jgi:hypothetical protein